MQLPHAEQQSTASIEESIDFVLSNAPSEMEIAASLAFYDDAEAYDGITPFEISERYSQFFKNTANEITKQLGQATYHGRLPEAFEWADTLEIDPSFDEIYVWKKDDKHVYLQFIWEDKDCPIVVALGAS